MTTRTSIENLTLAYGALVLRATGRQCFKKTGVQSRPKIPYATVYFQEIVGVEKPIIETVMLDDSSPETFQQIPWGTSLLQLEVQFYGSRINDTAIQAANRFKSSLYLEKRFDDVWRVSALSGAPQVIDLSLAFREDIEQRAIVKIAIYANIVDPLPLNDTKIYDIHSQPIIISGNPPEIDFVVTGPDEI